MRKGVRAACVLATSLGLLTTGCGDKHRAVPSSGGLAQPTSPGTESPPATEAPASSPPTTQGPESSPPMATMTPTGPAEVRAKDVSNLGRILVDGKDMTLYLFEKDKGQGQGQGNGQTGKPTCTGECAKAWPPLLTTDKPTAGQGVNASLLGMVDRPEGTKQVTYNGWPLYRYAKDTKPGDMTGQGVSAFGAKWYVVDANKGTKLEKK
jgi:predicted lipoprotein with Yx(FWY)xxD motif